MSADKANRVNEFENVAQRQKELKLRRYFVGDREQALDKISDSVQALKENNDVTSIFDELPGSVPIPDDVEIKVVYKDGKAGHKLEYQIRWPVKSSGRQPF